MSRIGAGSLILCVALVLLLWQGFIDEQRTLMDPPCQVSTEIAATLRSTRGVTDCGVVDARGEPEVVDRARSCVFASVEARRPFSLVIIEAGIDSRVESGYFGRFERDRFTLRSIAYDGSPSGHGDSDPHSQTYRCADLTPRTEPGASPRYRGIRDDDPAPVVSIEGLVTCVGAKLEASCP